MQKIWLNAYPAGVPREINSCDYQSVNEIFQLSCQKFSDCPAFSNMGHQLTYQEVYKKSQIFAAFLQQTLKLKKGDRVAIMLPNLLQYPIVLFGSLMAGCIVVNINPLYTASELSHQLKDSGAETIIVLSNFASTLEESLPNTLIKHIIITHVGDCLPKLKGMIVNTLIKYTKKIKAYSLPTAHALRKILHYSSPAAFQPVNLTREDTAFLQYTGGTTGVARGAVITHGNMVANMLQVYGYVKIFLTERKEIIVTPLPLYHIFSLMINGLVFIMFGGMSLLITNPRDINSFVKTLKKYRFTIITGVNTLFNALLAHPRFAEVNFNALHIALGGGMAVQQSVAEKWHKVTGKYLSEGYGLTEASPVVAINPLNLTSYNGSIGLPVPSTEISIRDEENQEVGLNQAGELCIKGPQVMKEYWGSPEETQKTFTADGWLKTGDVVTMDNKGFLYIIDRKKDMILVSGFNVYPTEIENVIAAHPGVQEVGVVGIITPIVGEIVKAVIVKSDPALSEEDIIKHCRLYLTGYKIPKKIEFRIALPKTNIGKILRRELKNSL